MIFPYKSFKFQTDCLGPLCPNLMACLTIKVSVGFQSDPYDLFTQRYEPLTQIIFSPSILNRFNKFNMPCES